MFSCISGQVSKLTKQLLVTVKRLVTEQTLASHLVSEQNKQCRQHVGNIGRHFPSPFIRGSVHLDSRLPSVLHRVEGEDAVSVRHTAQEDATPSALSACQLVAPGHAASLPVGPCV